MSRWLTVYSRAIFTCRPKNIFQTDTFSTTIVLLFIKKKGLSSQIFKCNESVAYFQNWPFVKFGLFSKCISFKSMYLFFILDPACQQIDQHHQCYLSDPRCALKDEENFNFVLHSLLAACIFVVVIASFILFLCLRERRKGTYMQTYIVPPFKKLSCREVKDTWTELNI